LFKPARQQHVRFSFGKPDDEFHFYGSKTFFDVLPLRFALGTDPKIAQSNVIVSFFASQVSQKLGGEL
jgi:hypothetical protein